GHRHWARAPREPLPETITWPTSRRRGGHSCASSERSDGGGLDGLRPHAGRKVAGHRDKNHSRNWPRSRPRSDPATAPDCSTPRGSFGPSSAEPPCHSRPEHKSTRACCGCPNRRKTSSPPEVRNRETRTSSTLTGRRRLPT